MKNLVDPDFQTCAMKALSHKASPFRNNFSDFAYWAKEKPKLLANQIRSVVSKGLCGRIMKVKRPEAMDFNVVNNRQTE